MKTQDITDNTLYNNAITHPLQTFEWGEFRKKTGITVIRKHGFQLTIHPIPKTPFTIGYFPKGPLPTKTIIEQLREIGKQNKCIFIQLEPNVDNGKLDLEQFGLKKAIHPLFTKYTFILDLKKSEEELLKNMHSKTRYNIKVAQRYDVEIKEDNSEKAFKEYLKLMEQTTKRQGFYAHSKKYHMLQWETFKHEISDNVLSSHLFVATYNKKVLVAWMVFVFNNTLYYPYGASSNEHREVMASNLMMWEVIRFGKKHNLKNFDMWGALGPQANSNDPWYGFHKFKQGYGPKLIEFVGSYDLIIYPMLYFLYTIVDKLRWVFLRLVK